MRKLTSSVLHVDRSRARLQPILVSRFLLNLRQAHLPAEDHAQASRFSQFSISNFHSPLIVGNMNASPEHNSPEDEVDNVVAAEIPVSVDPAVVGGEGTGAGPSIVRQAEEGRIRVVRDFDYTGFISNLQCTSR